MFEIVLYEPEIPPNTGNALRLCANVGARLHLIEPLGFILSDRRLRRAGLDYGDRDNIQLHATLSDCKRVLTGRRWLAVSTRGQRRYHDVEYHAGDVLLFGPETRGLPTSVLDAFAPECIVRVPMLPTSRSLNSAVPPASTRRRKSGAAFVPRRAGFTASSTPWTK